MIIRLPVITRDEMRDGKRLFEYEEREVTMINTMAAQMRWEAVFPEIAKNESLVDYSLRIKDLDTNSLPVLISKMKIIYCFLKTDMTFPDFLDLFDLSQKEYAGKLIDRLKNAFELVFDTASEKN